MIVKVHPYRQLSVPASASTWKTVWFVGILLVVAAMYRENLARILGNVIFLQVERARNQQNVDSAFWWSEFAYQTGLGQATNFDQAAMLAARLGRTEEQSLWLARAMSADQHTASVLNNVAVTHFLQKKSEAIQPLFEEAFTVAPDNALLRYNLGMALLQEGKQVDAFQLLKEATYIDDKWSLPYLQLSRLSLQMGDFRQAEAAARSSIRLAPSQLTTHLALIHSLSAQASRLDELLAATEEALTYFPKDPALQLYKALFLRDQGEREAALELMRSLYVAALDPQIHERLAKEIHLLYQLSSAKP